MDSQLTPAEEGKRHQTWPPVVRRLEALAGFLKIRRPRNFVLDRSLTQRRVCLFSGGQKDPDLSYIKGEDNGDGKFLRIKRKRMMKQFETCFLAQEKAFANFLKLWLYLLL